MAVVSEIKRNFMFYSSIVGILVTLVLTFVAQFKYIPIKDLKQAIFKIPNKEKKLEEIYQMLQEISKNCENCDYLYIDTGIIKLLYSIIEFKTHYPVIFNQIVQYVDEFLKITNYCVNNRNFQKEYVQNMEQLKSNIIREFNSFYLNIHSQNALRNRKLKQSIHSMNYLLNLNIKHAKKINNFAYHNETINIHSKHFDLLEIKPFAGTALRELVETQKQHIY